MWIQNTREFPAATKYVYEELPKVLHVPRIVRNVHRFGGLSIAELTAALRPYSPPYLMNDRFFRSPTKYGFDNMLWDIKPEEPNSIHLSRTLFRNFEKKWATFYTNPSFVPHPQGGTEILDQKGKLLGRFEIKQVYLLGVCILSALVDWGYFAKHGTRDDDAARNFQLQTYRFDFLKYWFDGNDPLHYTYQARLE
jgi:hypothetical protein